MNDHAKWIQANLNHKGQRISPFGERVAYLLGVMYYGIYHISREVMHERVKWDDNHHIEIVLWGGMSTYDYDELTRLVLLAHFLCVRVELSGAANNFLRLVFYPRMRSDKNMEGHPTIEQAINNITLEDYLSNDDIEAIYNARHSMSI